ncbi:hypothetical protein C440_05003 [Haloferax mucosum ATCC BAA-1512]|uniref:Twin-arginine translocation signal domain-containing protein n=1 Tax=Haloferax mucosum ATCC BAA-1512 TaxID=662479 RepID=M0IKV3_9EURY|nr:twin-arginine translocation signal domain-containing protein [Haloferax mucosum]ELZ96478.1 hypothetical protein C440_05003 [Haloferax mucosum ATCC BAA-1512]
MERRTFLKSATAAGALLTTAGCLGGGSGSDTANNSTTGNSSATQTEEPAPVPEPDLTFKNKSGVLRVVHMGGDKIKNETTTEVYVTVDDERAQTWVADDKETQAYPLSVGNFLKLESATAGSTVEVVWVGRAGTESVLASHDVPAEETAMNETATNETATNETAMNETVTNETAMNETNTTSTNETNTTSNTTDSE